MGRDFSLMGPEHVQRYVETQGNVGHHWNDVCCLVLWTTGRTSGERRAVPLIYGTQDGRLLVVASRGGSKRHPAWLLNLREDPAVEVQVGPDRGAATAVELEGDERREAWRTMTDIWPDYDDYQRRTDREIPVVALETDFAWESGYA